MKHILVTGGAGFIGSNLIELLLKDQETKVTCFDNFDSFYSREQKAFNILPFSGSPNFEFIEGDIRNVSDLMKTGDVNVIVHLAAKAGVRPSIKDPSGYFDVNIKGTHTLLEFAKERSIKQFVFASSSSVYGVNNNVPWKEDEKLLPISPYASTKLSGEMLGHVYSHLYGVRFIALRFFTVYGPAQRPDLAIYKFMKGILQEEPIFAGEGNTSRDYTFVKDIIKGISAAINYDKSDFEIFNLGNHNTITLDELIEAIEETCNKKAIIFRQSEQPGDVPQTFADISKAQHFLNYAPSTTLHEGLFSFLQWLRQNETVLQ